MYRTKLPPSPHHHLIPSFWSHILFYWKVEESSRNCGSCFFFWYNIQFRRLIWARLCFYSTREGKSSFNLQSLKFWLTLFSEYQKFSGDNYSGSLGFTADIYFGFFLIFEKRSRDIWSKFCFQRKRFKFSKFWRKKGKMWIVNLTDTVYLFWERELSFLQKTGCGLTAGVITVFIMLPTSSILTRMQTRSLKVTREQIMFERWLWQIFKWHRKLWKKGNIRWWRSTLTWFWRSEEITPNYPPSEIFRKK